MTNLRHNMVMDFRMALTNWRSVAKSEISDSQIEKKTEEFRASVESAYKNAQEKWDEIKSDVRNSTKSIINYSPEMYITVQELMEIGIPVENGDTHLHEDSYIMRTAILFNIETEGENVFLYIDFTQPFQTIAERGTVVLEGL